MNKVKLHKAYKYRIYPNKEQQVLLEKHFGATRWMYNFALETKQKHYQQTKKGISKYQIQAMLPKLKQEKEWLKEVNSQSLQYSLLCLENAFTRFFREKKGFPKFKNKFGKQSFTCPQNYSIENNRLFIPKFKQGIKIVQHRELTGKNILATITKTRTSKYYVSICTEQEVVIKKQKQQKKTSIGIDVGLKDFLVTSKGDRISRINFTKKLEKHLAKLQRKQCRQIKGSKGRQKTNTRVARVHEKIRNSRADFLHKVTRQLINENQVNTYCLEDLNISGMLRNHKLAKSIQDVSWYEFVRQLTYKSAWAGKNIIQIGRFEASSKTCNKCGSINKELTLKDREWICKNCGTTHDRDINAAKNILDFSYHKNVTRLGISQCNADGEVAKLPLRSQKPKQLAAG